MLVRTNRTGDDEVDGDDRQRLAITRVVSDDIGIGERVPINRFRMGTVLVEDQVEMPLCRVEPRSRLQVNDMVPGQTRSVEVWTVTVRVLRATNQIGRWASSSPSLSDVKS